MSLPSLLVLALETLRCGLVWDGAGHLIADGRIQIEGERILAIGPAAALPAAPQEKDLRPLFCMPGFVDAHTHLTSYVRGPDDGDETRHRAAQESARRTLEAGVTSARDLGDSQGDGIWLREAIRQGRFQGPRLQVACDQIGPNPLHRGLSEREIRALVRAHVSAGCDVIKLFATEGIGGSERLLSREQLAAAVAQAHELHRRVAVHVIGRQAISDTIDAGADSIDHGDETDVALAHRMAHAGIVLVPTLYILRYYIDDAPNIQFTPEHVARLRALVEGPPLRTFERRFPQILRTGVRIAAGSDAFLKLHGKNATEMVWLTRAGLLPERALEAMTRVAADLMGWSDRVGVLAPGHYADIVGLDGDPRTDIRRVEAAHVRFVMKGGVVIRREALP